MGVSGTVGLLKRHGHHFRESIKLRDTPLVIDVTEAMYWLVKNHYIVGRRVDLAGWSQVELGNFFKTFFKRLIERNVRPIIVYNGARVREKLHGHLAAKNYFLAASCRGAMSRILKGKYTIQMADLCLSTLKEVINEFGFEQVHQSCFESHRLLAQLAHKHQCPVLTSHSDFIFTSTPRGFVWIDEMPPISEWPLAPEVDIAGLMVYKHERLVEHFKVHSSALSALYVLLRDDFTTSHYRAVNETLGLHGSGLELGSRARDGNKTRRLERVLQRWPPRLTSMDEVRRLIISFSNTSANLFLKRDFDGIWTSYETDKPFGQQTSSFVEDNFLPTKQIGDLNDALTRRECSANFILNMRREENFNRLVVEDVRNTMRSSFSLADRVRQFIRAQLELNEQQELFDRCYDYMESRELTWMTLSDEQSGALTKERLFALFHFGTSQHERLAKELQRHLHVDEGDARRLALVLLLARFGFRIAFRETFENASPLTPESGKQVAAQKTITSRSRSNSNGKLNNTARAYYQYREMFNVALINSFVYHESGQKGDIMRQEIPAEHRVMRRRLDQFCDSSADSNLTLVSRHDQRNLIAHKHLIEMLNSTLHAYKELNSLYNFQGPNVLVHRHYDGILIYQIMSKWSNNLRDSLLTLTEHISDLVRP